VPKKPLVGVASLVVVTLVGWVVYHRLHSNTTASAAARGQTMPVPVVEGIVTTRDVPIYLDGLGTVQAFNTVTVHARVDGQLMKVAFTEGKEVKIDDVLAQLDPASYQAALDQAVAKKAQDEAQLTNARVDLQRYAGLLKTDSITQQIYDTQKSLVSQLEATVKADQAAMESAKVNLDYTTIRSPIDGRVGIRQNGRGQHCSRLRRERPRSAHAASPISSCLRCPNNRSRNSSNIKIRRRIQRARRFSRQHNVLDKGTLAAIDNQIDTTTGTIKLKANFANENLHLWPGQFVNTRLLLATRRTARLFRRPWFNADQTARFAFVIQNDQTVTMRPLQVAQIESGMALIDEGLKPGERIVLDGQYKLQPGSHVKPAESSDQGGADGAQPTAKTHPGKQP